MVPPLKLNARGPELLKAPLMARAPLLEKVPPLSVSVFPVAIVQLPVLERALLPRVVSVLTATAPALLMFALITRGPPPTPTSTLMEPVFVRVPLETERIAPAP